MWAERAGGLKLRPVLIQYFTCGLSGLHIASETLGS